jgi:hypothetical protein
MDRLGQFGSKGEARHALPDLQRGFRTMSETITEVAYTIFRPGMPPMFGAVAWPDEPGYDRIRMLIEPLLEGAHLEHVSVLHEGRRADMFVDDEGRLKHLPRNEEATAIYRAAALSREPDRDPETIPFIAGTAILFDRRVWF